MSRHETLSRISDVSIPEVYRNVSKFEQLASRLGGRNDTPNLLKRMRRRRSNILTLLNEVKADLIQVRDIKRLSLRKEAEPVVIAQEQLSRERKRGRDADPKEVRERELALEVALAREQRLAVCRSGMEIVYEEDLEAAQKAFLQAEVVVWDLLDKYDPFLPSSCRDDVLPLEGEIEVFEFGAVLADEKDCYVYRQPSLKEFLLMKVIPGVVAFWWLTNVLVGIYERLRQ